MTQPYRKKLIEVALPLEAINEESSLRKRKAPGGYPTTLHKWWAQRPLAACRAVLFASFVDDPDSDPAYARYDPVTREHMAGEKRQQVFDLIAELVKWENTNDELVINAARAEIARCVASRKIETGELKKDHKLPGGETVYDLVVKGHGDLNKLRQNVVRLPKAESVNAFLAKYAPPVLDPFAGGGSIPLEAQRLGLRACGADLNPVPVLINKALIELPAKCANMPPVHPEALRQQTTNVAWKGIKGLVEDVWQYGKWIRDEAEKRFGHMYPKVTVTPQLVKQRPDLSAHVGQHFPAVAWFWARTVESPDPSCARAHVPLVSSFWLSTKANSPVWLEPRVDRANNTYTFTVRQGTPPADARRQIGSGTKTGRGCNFRCLLSGQPIPEDHVKQQGCAGRLGVRLMAVAVDSPTGRIYLPASVVPDGVDVPPPGLAALDAPIANDKRALWCALYGLKTFGSLFTPRQATALVGFSRLVVEARSRVHADAMRQLDSEKASAYADAVATYLAFAVSRAADYNSSLASWRPKDNALRSSLAKQGLPVVWDFAEANPFAKSSAGFSDCVNVVIKCLEFVPIFPPGIAIQADAVQSSTAVNQPVVCTDPPYYDNIGYADLSDFLYVWLRLCLAGQYPQLFATMVTPKVQELIASPYRHDGDRQRATAFFEMGLEQVFKRAYGITAHDCPMTVFYAFKQAESEDGDKVEQGAALTASVVSTGWETILSALVNAGFWVTGTWPMRTEGDNRQVGIGANALASSIVLVCRPRDSDAPLASRREFLAALKRELPESLKHLQRGSIAPVDLAQASIGPGMAVFTRYAKVIEADGSTMKVRQALALINQMLDEVLAEQEGEFDGDTRWALAWFEQYSMDDGAFGMAETLSKAKNTAVNALVEAGIVKARAGKVRLLKRDELPDEWNPATDHKVRHWEVAQHLIRALETGGETAAADLLRRVGGMGEVARDLAYRLYNICERKGWASEALAYNGLVIAWPEISKLAQGQTPRVATSQAEMF